MIRDGAKYEPTTQKPPGWRERVRQVLVREPDLEAWQLAERFGLTERRASVLRDQLLREEGIALRAWRRRSAA